MQTSRNPTSGSPAILTVAMAPTTPISAAVLAEIRVWNFDSGRPNVASALMRTGYGASGGSIGGLSARPARVGEVVSASELLGDDHPPRIDDQFAGLGGIECLELRFDPVEPELGRAGHAELVRLAVDERRALFFGEGEAHDTFVQGERGVDNRADAEPQSA